MLSARNLSRASVGLLTALALGPAANALTISGLTPVLGGSNTGQITTDNGNNRSQTTSAVATTQAPSAAPDTIGSFSEFITRYSMNVVADRTNSTASTTANMTSSYSITFTVNNPAGGSLRIDIDTLRVGALTSTDEAGSSTITLGAVTGQLDTVGQANLGLPSVGGTLSTTAINTAFSQSGSTLSIFTSALTSTYVLQFDFSSTVLSAQDAGAIRMGETGGISSTTADNYPGAGARVQANDGHFVTVRSTIISMPEPESGALVAFGLLGLALRGRRPRQ